MRNHLSIKQWSLCLCNEPYIHWKKTKSKGKAIKCSLVLQQDITMWKTGCILRILLSVDRSIGRKIQSQPDFSVMSDTVWSSKPGFSLACKMHIGCSSSCRRSHTGFLYRVTSEIWMEQDKPFFCKGRLGRQASKVIQFPRCREVREIDTASLRDTWSTDSCTTHQL